jgi:hypothetical protein
LTLLDYRTSKTEPKTRQRRCLSTLGRLSNAVVESRFTFLYASVQRLMKNQSTSQGKHSMCSSRQSLFAIQQ